MRPFAVLALLLAIYSVGVARAEKIAVSGCNFGTYDPLPKLMPLTPGPLTLTALHCLNLPTANNPGPLQPSPNQKGIFTLAVSDGLFLSEIGDTRALQHFDAQETGPEEPFAWAADSRSVFGARQERMKPRGGWALGPLRPYRFRIDGIAEKLPEMTNPAGPLDEIYWIGHKGVAIAAFGTRGEYYRPEHPDPMPTIAFVDALTGKTLQSIAVAEVLGVNGEYKSIGLPILRVVSEIDERGDPYAAITLPPNRLVLWVQGQLPSAVPIDEKLWRKGMAVSPGRKRLLIMDGLSATSTGPICETWSKSKCPAPTPQSGSIATLRELPSGNRLWSIEGTAANFASYKDPAISPDGRFALIMMPAGTAALLSMKNGAVLQEIPIRHGPSCCAMGFSVDGKGIWISDSQQVAFYRLSLTSN